MDEAFILGFAQNVFKSSIDPGRSGTCGQSDCGRFVQLISNGDPD